MKANAGEVYTVYNQYLKRYTACQVAYITPPDTVSKESWAAVSYTHLDVYKRQQKKLKWAADFEFALFPYLVNGIKNHLEEAYFRDMSGCELAEIEQAAGEKCQPIGHIGYYYPAEVWISEYGKLYAKYEYQDEIECFPDVFALIERELRQCNFDSAAMKTVEALDGKI